MNTVKKILIAEDETTLLHLLVETFQDEGYEVIQALDGEQVLAMISLHAPDLVLLDVQMPKKDGYAVLKEIRETMPDSGMKIVMLTNLSKRSNGGEMEELEGITYLVKSDSSLDRIIETAKKELGDG